MPGVAAPVRRAFVTVGHRQVHYRRAGAGPPVVLLHESPRSSASMLWLIQALAQRFVVIALDTPGYGGSETLPLSRTEISDYADATAEALVALGLDRVGVYGVHTGAAIGLELAARHPEHVSAVVLDGLPLHTDAERAERLARYAPALEPRIDGTHMLAMWARQRDQYLFYPWYRREAATRRTVPMPSARVLHEGVMDILRAGAGYGRAYDAAFRHRAEPALRDLRVPALLLYRAQDVLSAHAERMPPEQAASTSLQRVDDDAAAASRTAEFLSAHAEATLNAHAQGPRRIPGRITRDYADTEYGQLLVRVVGEGDTPPLVMLHASPGSADALLGAMQRLAERGRRVLALDTLGNGESDKPPWQVAEIADYAPVVAQSLKALGEDVFDLYGTHTGAHVALEVALLEPDRVRHLVLDGVAMFEQHYVNYLLDNYTPPLEPRDDGTHLLWAWSFMCDQTLFWPWFNRTPDGIRHVEPIEADALHRWYVEVLKSGETYPIGYRAAFRHRMRERLPRLRTPTLMIAAAGDMLLDATLSAAKLAPNATAATLPEDPARAAQLISDFLT